MGVTTEHCSFRPRTGRGVASLLFLLTCVAQPVRSQQPPVSAASTIRVQSSLVLVDVVSRDFNNGLPVRDFKKQDFRMLVEGKEVPISTFDLGADTRPVAIWLVVICNEAGKAGGSAEFVGSEAMFRPAFDHLDPRDTVGVAHWCDNGEAQLDLSPTADREQPTRVLAETIKPIAFRVGGDSDAIGEVAFRKLIRLIIRDANRRNPQPLPVIVFLDGDYTGQPHGELDQVVNDFLETSGIVFGIKDSRVGRGPRFFIGEVAQIEHYIAHHTGGEYFVAPPSGYAAALEAILAQLHGRYELGFTPPEVDGRRHSVKVELTREAKEKHKGARLRFRPEYIPVREEPEWAR